MNDEDIMALEREGWDALSGPDGGEYYSRRLDDDALMAFPFGVLDRAQALAAMSSAPPWSRYAIRDAHVLRLGNDAATITYNVAAQREGQSEFRAVVTSAYVRRGDQWKLALHQQSPSS
jgi:Domain of unknown function (DUF4440)